MSCNGPFTVQSHIYIYIYTLWSYYLGQVWPFRCYFVGQMDVIICAKFVFLPILIVVSNVFFAHSVIILWFLGASYQAISKNNIFQNCCVHFLFFSWIFYFAEALSNRWFQQVYFCCSKKIQGQQTGQMEFLVLGFWGSNMAVSWPSIVFVFLVLLKPLFW